MNYFFLCDSPTLDTGFAKVSLNILKQLNLENVHVWGLGYMGEAHKFDFNIYPANVNVSWEAPKSIRNFNEFLNSFMGDRTLWLLHDPCRLKKFKDVIRQQKMLGTRVIAYVPVDSPLDEQDRAYLDLVDICVAYTTYGKNEILKICPDKQVLIIPHGYDENFYSIPNTKREIFSRLPEESFLIGNVNSNTERKGLARSLEILAELLKISADYYMYFHCNPHGYYKLSRLAKCLGVESHVVINESVFQNRIGKSNCDIELLNKVYNALDLYLSTSYGEGWGLTAAEAASCEIPLCLPNHTAFDSIYTKDACLWLEGDRTTVYNNKIVPDIDPVQSAKIIHSYRENPNLDLSIAKNCVEVYNWKDIVKLWEKIIKY